MSEITVAEFAETLKVPVDRLIAQLDEAGISVEGATDVISEDAKLELLTHLRRSHGKQDAAAASPKKITLKRKSQSELRLAAGQGRSRTVNVEVRRKRTYTRRDVLEEQARKQQEELDASRRAEQEARESAELAEKQRLEALEAERRRQSEALQAEDREREEAEKRRQEEADEESRRQAEEARRASEDAAREAKEREREANRERDDRVDHGSTNITPESPASLISRRCSPLRASSTPTAPKSMCRTNSSGAGSCVTAMLCTPKLGKTKSRIFPIVPSASKPAWGPRTAGIRLGASNTSTRFLAGRS